MRKLCSVARVSLGHRSAAIVATAAWSVVALPASAQDCVSESLSSSDWASIRAAWEANRHAAFKVPDGYQARNRSQQWLVHFDHCGFTAAPDSGGWVWGLELVSHGRAGHEQAALLPSCIDADGGRVRFEWGDSLTEWFVNDARGLEHGFTVHKRADATSASCGRDELQFRLSVRGALRPQVSDDGRSVTFLDATGASVVHYAGLTVFDADGAVLPGRFQPVEITEGTVAPELVLSVDDHLAQYPLTIDPIAQQAYLKPSNTNAFDHFGAAVAMSGDTVVVGADQEDSNATGVNGNQADNSAGGSGAAYVFVRTGATWSQQAYLKASNTGALDDFASSVSISGDTIVVGARREDSNATGVNGNQSNNSAESAGAAYVFTRSNGVWTQQAYLKASNSEYGDLFGEGVAVLGDTIVVGAIGESSNATGINGSQSNNSIAASGAAYVFVRSGGVWSQQAYVKASNPGEIDSFGQSIALSGETMVIAAPIESSNATGVNGNQNNDLSEYSGAAYVFVRSGANWSQQAYLKASNTGSGDQFGGSVAIEGDTIVVGARVENSSSTGVNGGQGSSAAYFGAGAAYVFVRNAGTWSQQAYLKASNTGQTDNFGHGVAIAGDTIVVSAPQEDSNASGMNGDQSNNSALDAGAAYVFARSAGVWTQQAYLKGSNTAQADHFGMSVAMSGNTIVIGADEEDSNATGVNGAQADNSMSMAGAAYVFVLPNSSQCGADLNGDNKVDGADLGKLLGSWGPCVGCASDLNGDGVVDDADLHTLLGAWGNCPPAPGGKALVSSTGPG